MAGVTCGGITDASLLKPYNRMALPAIMPHRRNCKPARTGLSSSMKPSLSGIALLAVTLSEGDHIVFRLRQTAVNTSPHLGSQRARSTCSPAGKLCARTRFSLAEILVLAGTTGAGGMAPPTSTKISARLKRAQGHSSAKNLIS